MAVKLVNIPEIGEVKLTKRSGTKRLKLRLSNKGEVVVSMPTWLPFKSGEKFAEGHREWIEKHRVEPKLLLPNRKIGKTHTLLFAVTDSVKPSVKVTENFVTVKVPVGMTLRSSLIQEVASRGVKKALKAQEEYLEKRLKEISNVTGLRYRASRYGFMKTRWGSCRSDNTITLNYNLLDLPDELINYVIIHELAHTRHLNHSPKFWALVESFAPNYKLLRKNVKKLNITS